jgi:hypothetical protein
MPQNLGQRTPIGPDLSTVDEELRRIYRPSAEGNPQYERMLMQDSLLGAPELPNVVTPPMFWNDMPGMIGPRNLSKLIEEYSRISPETMAGISRISVAPTESILRYRDDPQSVPAWGLHEREPESGMGEIWIEPSLTKNQFNAEWLEKVLAHELGHQAGYGHSREMSNIEGLAEMRAKAKEMQWLKEIGQMGQVQGRKKKR